MGKKRRNYPKQLKGEMGNGEAIEGNDLVGLLAAPME
jgi:hypothetical protein